MHTFLNSSKQSSKTSKCAKYNCSCSINIPSLIALLETQARLHTYIHYAYILYMTTKKGIQKTKKCATRFWCDILWLWALWDRKVSSIKKKLQYTLVWFWMLISLLWDILYYYLCGNKCNSISMSLNVIYFML